MIFNGWHYDTYRQFNLINGNWFGFRVIWHNRKLSYIGLFINDNKFGWVDDSFDQGSGFYLNDVKI